MLIGYTPKSTGKYEVLATVDSVHVRHGRLYVNSKAAFDAAKALAQGRGLKDVCVVDRRSKKMWWIS